MKKTAEGYIITGPRNNTWKNIKEFVDDTRSYNSQHTQSDNVVVDIKQDLITWKSLMDINTEECSHYILQWEYKKSYKKTKKSQSI